MGGSSSDPAALRESALAALARGEAARAKELLGELVAIGRADATVWLAMAQACAGAGDAPGKAAALDKALALEPHDLRVLMAKADHLAESGDQRGASAYYAAALQYMPRYNALPPHLQEALRRAHAAKERLARELEDFVRARLAAEGFQQA